MPLLQRRPLPAGLLTGPCSPPAPPVTPSLFTCSARARRCSSLAHMAAVLPSQSTSVARSSSTRLQGKAAAVSGHRVRPVAEPTPMRRTGSFWYLSWMRHCRQQRRGTPAAQEDVGRSRCVNAMKHMASLHSSAKPSRRVLEEENFTMRTPLWRALQGIPLREENSLQGRHTRKVEQQCNAPGDCLCGRLLVLASGVGLDEALL